jgi:hypothetical protein
MHFGNAERVAIESDERGFLLRIDADTFGEITVRLDTETAEQLHDAARADIRPWILERDAARATFARSFHCDPDESAGLAEVYEIRDPKHPRHHSVHADLWDAREGK